MPFWRDRARPAPPSLTYEVTASPEAGAVRVRVNGIDVHCEVSGADRNPWLLCLHSLATDGGIWEAYLGALEASFRVVRPDLRGHGQTEATAPPYSLDLLVEDTIGLMDALDIQRTSVLGLSIGAIIAMGLALDVPDRIERAVVADARADAPPAYVQMWDNAVATAEADGVEPVVNSSVARWFSQPFIDSGAPEIERLRTRALRTSLDGLIGCARAVQGLNYLPRLHEIRVPILFVVGGEDPAAPPAVMRDMASRVPGADLIELPGAGHLTPVEVPEAFAAAVLPFLEKSP